LRYAILNGADLSEITSFNGVYLYRTAWWQAKRISRELLEYLIKNWPYEEGAYGPTDVVILPEEYGEALARLRTNK